MHESRENVEMEGIRLQKYLADAGMASRRRAEEMIACGRVEVNGVIVTQPGTKVESFDIVKLDGKNVEPVKNKIYIMLNKPAGFVSTVKDQFSRKTVIDLLKGINERVYPVGRLDYDSSGLLLITNDGEFAYRLTHPKHDINKTYIAEVAGTPAEEKLMLLRKGLLIDSYVTSPATVSNVNSSGEKTVLEIVIHEGKNRQVRKMCEAIGHPVLKLKRVAVGELKLGNLREGEWRHITGSELNLLK
jgi:23S rRNA pseudouridine2605 synthase